MYSLPPNAPVNLYEAFAYIGAVQAPSLDDLRLMLVLEAAGKAMYDSLAESAPNAESAQYLRESGLDELKHAERLAEILGLLTGAPCAVPAPEENPYLAEWEKPRLSMELIERLASAEANGGALYEGWAQVCSNAEAAALLRMSGREETAHAQRLHSIAQCLKS